MIVGIDAVYQAREYMIAMSSTFNLNLTKYFHQVDKQVRPQKGMTFE
jgi:hypothetical protein